MSTDDLVRAVHDRQEIHQVLVRYCRGIDRCDEQLVLSAFHDDARDDHTGVEERVAERVPGVIAKARTNARWTSHNLTNVLIELEGDVANSEAYLIAYHRLEHEGLDDELPGADMAQAIDLARMADEAGLHGVAMGEHLALGSRLDRYPYAGGLRHPEANRTP